MSKEERNHPAGQMFLQTHIITSDPPWGLKKQKNNLDKERKKERKYIYMGAHRAGSMANMSSQGRWAINLGRSVQLQNEKWGIIVS